MMVRTRTARFVVACCALAAAPEAHAQTAKWEILDNSFLVEEGFNQERSVVQNIFTWTRVAPRQWAAAFTQEWPVPDMRHQLSYTIPLSANGDVRGLNDVLLNYRYQLVEEGADVPAIAPRVSAILPTGNEDEGLGGGVYGLQIAVPASKRFGDVYVHGNAGWTWHPGVDQAGFVAASGIWRTTPMFHLMVEAFKQAGDAATLSPGFRRGWNFGERQLVLGAAAPLSWSDGATDVAVLTYVSYELPFR